MEDNKIIDKSYLQVLNNTLSEWESEYDEEDYKYLQDIEKIRKRTLPTTILVNLLC